MKKEKIGVDKLMTIILEAAQDKKAINISSINLSYQENSIADYFIICEGSSSTHRKSIIDNIEKETIEKYKIKPLHNEGIESSEWILMDYFNIIIHVFSKEARDFYNIEGMWESSLQKTYEYNI